jgi:Cdc6-like AAA superfamily ATPase
MLSGSDMTDTSTPHLSDTARRALDLADAHRIALIDRDLWIGYGRARDAHTRLEQILRSERRMRPDNLLIVGASNNGKTAIARRFLARHAIAENPDAESSRIETTLVQAPNGPSISQLLRSILTALGREPGQRPTSARLRTEVHHAMRDVGLRLLLIDDLHNIRGSRVGSMLVELREIGSITGVSIGAFATKEIAHVFRLDEQLANRFALLTLPRWQFDDLEYAQLLATFEQHLPLRRPSHLTSADLARHILTQAGGLIGGIATILRQAAIAAIESGHERIDRSILDRMIISTPEQIEAVATAPNL